MLKLILLSALIKYKLMINSPAFNVLISEVTKRIFVKEAILHKGHFGFIIDIKNYLVELQFRLYVEKIDVSITT